MYSPWDASIVFFKFAELVSVALTLGGFFSFYLIGNMNLSVGRHIQKYIILGSLIGLISALLFFLVQIGAINLTGITGMFDVQIGFILAQSEIGYSTALRLIGFILGIIFSLLLFKVSGYFLLAGFSIIALFIASSFSLIGHVAILETSAKIAISLHVFAMSLWIGALYPLRYVIDALETKDLAQIMKKFGRIAIGIVTILVISGVYLITQLIGSFTELISTNYGQSLTLKLLSVSVLLLLAATNKLMLVPSLDKPNGKLFLKRSIFFEMCIAFLIMLLTAYFTTLTGIQHE